MSTSNGTIPQGLMLYSFTYPEGDWAEDLISGMFLESDEEALLIGKNSGAIVITHVFSGRELLPKQQ